MKARKLRQYEPIWIHLRDNRNSTVTVTVHQDFAARLIRAVRKEKSRQTVIRNSIGAGSWGDLKANITPHATQENMVCIKLSLDYDMRNL